MQALPDTSSELVFQPFRNGVQLVRPEAVGVDHCGYSVAKMLDLPFSVYFKNAEAEAINVCVNDITAADVGADSRFDFVGKAAAHFIKKGFVERLYHHDQAVIKTQKTIIQDANFRRINDDLEVQTIAIKIPWYSLDNEVIGIFGCSLRLDSRDCSLAQGLTILSEIGLLKQNNDLDSQPILPGIQFKEYYFTKREKDILSEVAFGKTAKEIGRKFNISYRTVQEYLNNLKLKIGVDTKSALTEKALYLFNKESTH